MKTDWQEIAKRVAIELDIPEKEVINEIKEYTEVLKDGLRNLKGIDYDFYMIGKLKPSSKKMNQYYEKHSYFKEAFKPSETQQKRYDAFFPFFKRWQELMKKGRWKVKGQYNPFK